MKMFLSRINWKSVFYRTVSIIDYALVAALAFTIGWYWREFFIDTSLKYNDVYRAGFFFTLLLVLVVNVSCRLAFWVGDKLCNLLFKVGGISNDS